MSNQDAESLLAKYAAAAIAHRDASATGDYRTANREHEVLARTYRELRSLGNRGETALESLLRHQDARVRAWAAAHALEFAPDLAEPVLQELVNTGGLLGFGAEMTLSEWRKGNLRFP